jgi:hypothetical protein
MHSNLAMLHLNIRFSSPPYRSRLALRQAETVVPLKYKRVLSIRVDWTHSPTHKDSCSTILANDLTSRGTSMEDSKREVNIDALRRDATDGSYHCPQCNAPFTRRSNLRRHYHIRELSSLLVLWSSIPSSTSLQTNAT